MHVPIALAAFGVGFVAGLRSMVAPAGVALARHERVATVVFACAAAIELIGDKLPIAPSRLRPGPLAVRCVVGAICGWLAGGPVWASALGLGGALVGSFAGAAYRRKFTGVAPAVIEDAVALVSAYFLLF